MCGIFAYKGRQRSPEILVDGLRKLEYRGYDSAGIAFFEQGKVQRIRAFGGVSELDKALEGKKFNGGLGIGHTRWATHGAPSEANAHPHQSSFIYLVHNGLLENYVELRQKISPDRIKSDTDTELIAHLLNDEHAKDGYDLLHAVLNVVGLLEGSYAVVVISEHSSDEMVAFKKGPPLVICKDGDGYCITSDPHVCADFSDQVVFLEDEEIVRVRGDELEFFDFDGKSVFKEFQTSPYDAIAFEKAGYEDYTIKEIIEQIDSIEHTVSTYVKRETGQVDMNIASHAKNNFDSLLANSASLMIVACGSSYYAALYGKYMIESIAPMRVDVEIASEFIYRDLFLQAGAPVLFISQSGETADTLAALKKARDNGMETIGLCNVKGSALDRSVSYRLYIGAGKEVGVASTKAFCSTLAALQLLGVYMANQKSNSTMLTAEKFFALAGHVEQVLGRKEFFVDLAQLMQKFHGFFYLGRGAYYPIALEGSLKLKELAYLHSDAHPAGEMKHGPLAMIDENIMVIALLPKEGVLFEKSMVNLIEVQARGACILAIGGNVKDKSKIESVCDYYFPLPEADDLQHPILSLVSVQLIAYYAAKACGRNVDKPRNLAKSVTVE